MDPQEFIQAIKDRDEHIEALREYALALENLLSEKRESVARTDAETRARSEWERAAEQLRYQHGLRTGTLTLR